MELVGKSIIWILKNIWKRKKHKLSKATYGFDRGQHELIIQILKKLKKLKKLYGVR